jgi:hypothetical protein
MGWSGFGLLRGGLREEVMWIVDVVMTKRKLLKGVMILTGMIINVHNYIDDMSRLLASSR